MRGKIIFYEEKNFQGRSYETSSNCADMSTHLSRCQSCKVESGCFMVYDRPNYMGQQYLLKRGEYSNYQRMMGFGDCIRSCRIIPPYQGSHRIRIFEMENFRGRMNELMEDCDNIQDRFQMSDLMSCHVMDGHWLMYERPRYQGRMIYLHPGEYSSFREMSNSRMRFCSIRRITDSC